MPTKRSDAATGVAKILRSYGVVRLRDFEQAGIPRATVLRLARAGEVERLGRGLYTLPGRDFTEWESLVHVAKRVPGGVVCLLTALSVYDLTDQNPHRVWLAIDRKARQPKLDWPPLEVVWWSADVLSFGVVEKSVGDMTIRATSPAKTVADCFKYRNKIGIDVAIEALKEYLGRRGRSMEELEQAAEVCRVGRVIRPYIEALA